MSKGKWFILLGIAAALAAGLALIGSPTQAQPGPKSFKADLEGFQEVPAISTMATGSFRATLIDDDELAFELTYSGLQGTVVQAHIHFGQTGANGGVVAFLCGGGGKPACPGPNSGTVVGTIVPANVIAGAAAQGIAAGEFDEVVNAMRAGVTYANVHSTVFPNGEIRGQINK